VPWHILIARTSADGMITGTGEIGGARCAVLHKKGWGV
jgi:hypothetical protein